MTETAERIKHQLASLSPEDQLALAEFLWDVVENPQWDRAWAVEAQRRWDSAERGESKYVSREEAMQRAKQRLERRP